MSYNKFRALYPRENSETECRDEEHELKEVKGKVEFVKEKKF